ncbi:MAG TPA: hypothetical protein VK177_09865 [Flavobacteriales bacterium]|nr:hypothetical protein [Flavobacteriales bacterium]
METFVKKLINGLSKEELRHLKISSQKYDLDPAARKDLRLVDYILKSGEAYDDDEISGKLYGSNDKNSFYRLKNRVNDSVEKSLLEMHYGKEPHSHCLSYIQLYRQFYQKNNLGIAIKYLEKAEKAALSISANDLLEIIYTEFIKLSYDMNVNPEEYIEKRKNCRSKMLEVQQIDDVLAILKYKIRVSQNLVKDGQVSDLLEKTLKQVTGKKTAENPDLYFKIYESVSRILLSNNDFNRLEKYLLSTYDECLRLKLFNKQNHKVKLQMLTYLVNTLFTVKKHRESLEWANTLRKAMDEFDKVHRSSFIFYYYNSMANNYTVMNKNKAVEYILAGLNDRDIQQSDLHTMYMYLNLCIQQFDLREYKSSLKSIQKIYINPQFNGLDNAFRYKIHLIECLNRFELKDYDILEKNFKNLRKKFDAEYRDRQLFNQRVMLDFLTGLVSRSNSRKVVDSRKAAAVALNGLDTAGGVNDLINYNEWLKTSFKI